MSEPLHATATATDDVANEPGDGSWTRQIDAVVRSLQVRLGTSADPSRIRAEVEAEFATFAAARVRDFVPVIAEAPRARAPAPAAAARGGVEASA